MSSGSGQKPLVAFLAHSSEPDKFSVACMVNVIGKLYMGYSQSACYMQIVV